MTIGTSVTYAVCSGLLSWRKFDISFNVCEAIKNTVICWLDTLDNSFVTTEYLNVVHPGLQGHMRSAVRVSPLPKTIEQGATYQPGY